jgi:hypothetical protein
MSENEQTTKKPDAKQTAEQTAQETLEQLTETVYQHIKERVVKDVGDNVFQRVQDILVKKILQQDRYITELQQQMTTLNENQQMEETKIQALSDATQLIAETVFPKMKRRKSSVKRVHFQPRETTPPPIQDAAAETVTPHDLSEAAVKALDALPWNPTKNPSWTQRGVPSTGQWIYTTNDAPLAQHLVELLQNTMRTFQDAQVTLGGFTYEFMGKLKQYMVRRPVTTELHGNDDEMDDEYEPNDDGNDEYVKQFNPCPSGFHLNEDGKCVPITGSPPRTLDPAKG